MMNKMEAARMTGELAALVLLLVVVGSAQETSSHSVLANNNSSDNADYGGAIIYMHENSNCFISVVVQDHWNSATKGQLTNDDSNRDQQTAVDRRYRRELCPLIRGQGNHNFPVRIEVGGRSCPLKPTPGGDALEPRPSSQVGHYLCPNVNLSFSSSVEIYVTSSANDGSPDRGRNSTMQASNVDYREKDHQMISYSGRNSTQPGDDHCPGIHVFKSTGVDIQIFIDDSQKYPKFEGINVNEQKGYKKSITVSNGDCPAPTINIVHCEHTIIRIHTITRD